ncbi:MAG: GNAT family N-acetyltransferase [Gemmatimonadota bacterium]
MSLSTRPATAEDNERIVLFNLAMARESEGRELDRGTLARGVDAVLKDPARGRYFVAEREGEVLGQLLVTKEWSDWRNGEIWWIQSVYVSKRFRREGIYARLHGHVRDLARQEKAIGLRLYVERHNEPARATYRSLGMRESDYLLYEELWA